MDRLIIFIATVGYSGTISKAPGTWGALAALVGWYFFRQLSLPLYLALLFAIFVIGFLTAGAAEKILDRPDPDCIVIDEFLGILITLAAAPENPLFWVLGFLLFRLFGMLKPFPVSWLYSRLHGGIGIMMDDVMAGVYAALVLQLLAWILL